MPRKGLRINETYVSSKIFSESLLTLFNDSNSFSFFNFNHHIKLDAIFVEPVFLKEYKNKQKIIAAYFRKKVNIFIVKLNFLIFEWLCKNELGYTIEKEPEEDFGKTVLYDLNFSKRKQLNTKCLNFPVACLNYKQNPVKYSTKIKSKSYEDRKMMLFEIRIRFIKKQQNSVFKVVKIDNKDTNPENRTKT